MALPAPLTALIESQAMTSALCIGFGDAGSEATDLTTEQVLEDGFSQRADLVAISATALNTDSTTRNALIAKSRDQLSSRVLLELSLPERQAEESSGMTETECLALGFVRCAVTETHQYYLFDLKTYKPVPDWLNPKFWANPENWDKYRW